MLSRRKTSAGLAATFAAGAAVAASGGTSAAAADGTTADIAMFRDATEMLFAVAERRAAAEPDAPWVPRRSFVKDADEAHEIAFRGTPPVVGMSLDDLIDCSRQDRQDAGELVAFAGVHRGFLQLIAAGDIASIRDLKGKRVAVDTDTGYASALFAMLRREGLERDRDYEVVYAGATNLRYEKLLGGGFDATLLGAPYTRLAMRREFRSLGTVIEAMGGYQGVVLVAHRAWLAGNAGKARQIVQCLTGTLAWAAKEQNRAVTEAVLQDSFPGLDRATAAEAARDLFGPGSDFLADGRMREPDIAVVLRLFNLSRGVSVTPQAVSARIDPSYLPPH